MASPRGRKRRLGVDFGQADAAGRKSVRERAALAREKSGAMRAREAAAARLLHLPPKTPPNPHCVGREWERERERKERGGGRRAAAHLRSSAGAGAGDFLVRVRPVREPPRARLRLTARAWLRLIRDSVPVRDDSSSIRRDPRPRDRLRLLVPLRPPRPRPQPRLCSVTARLAGTSSPPSAALRLSSSSPFFLRSSSPSFPCSALLSSSSPSFLCSAPSCTLLYFAFSALLVSPIYLLQFDNWNG
jgi:hypothetical protein